MNRFLNIRKFLMQIFILFFLIENASAQTEKTPDALVKFNILLFVIVVLLIIAAFGYFGMGKGINRAPVISPYLKRIKNYFIGLAPIEKEKDITLDHDFDGIKELDNRIPPWFNYLFYGTILFGIYYMIDYHVLERGLLPHQEYEEEMRIAALEREQLINSGAFLNENTVTLLTDNESLIAGKEIYSKNCIPCHGVNGEGSVGPNLTDEYWIHGGSIRNIFSTIKYGVPAKGMVSWQGTLNPAQIQQVASYIISIRGTNPPNAKQPEGEKYVDADSTGQSISMR